ncbi:hypothetical protein [Moorena sp. SIO3H5]|nr:hypothetical protein [Moorena sp. SIO3H5]
MAAQEITTIGTTQAAYLLGICVQRVRQLLKSGRIKGFVTVIKNIL